MSAKPDTVRALKRLERAARDAAGALARDRDDAVDDLVAELAKRGIGFHTEPAQAEPQEGHSE